MRLRLPARKCFEVSSSMSRFEIVTGCERENKCELKHEHKYKYELIR
jgi:hypothetical protein